jgi:hypothetical protein
MQSFSHRKYIDNGFVGMLSKNHIYFMQAIVVGITIIAQCLSFSPYNTSLSLKCIEISASASA